MNSMDAYQDRYSVSNKTASSTILYPTEELATTPLLSAENVSTSNDISEQMNERNITSMRTGASSLILDYPPLFAFPYIIPKVEEPLIDLFTSPMSEGIQYETDQNIILGKISMCFEFSIDNVQLTKICYAIETKVYDVTQWYRLRHLNIAGKNITSLNDLALSFPMLETLDISHNELKFITHLPKSLRYLHASNNKLSGLDIYQLKELQFLDVSNNKISEFEDMTELKLLHTLDASHNNIESCKIFDTLPGLITLSLKNNSIRQLYGFSRSNTHRLKSLDLSFNLIERFCTIDVLPHLVELNMNNNYIKIIQLYQPMQRLCNLHLCFNRLTNIDVSYFPNIRILLLDDNQIQNIDGASNISRIASFSLRDQEKERDFIDLHDLRGTHKLYLSNGIFRKMHQLVDFYSLEYLELCSAQLHVLPEDFSSRVPNLCHLYLGMNQLQDIKPLKRLRFLKQLILICNKITSLNQVISVVKHLNRLHVLDLRQNSITAHIYPQLDITDHDSMIPYITQDAGWPSENLEFCETLSSHWKTRRNLYRSLLIKACPNLKQLDYLPVTSSDISNVDNFIGDYYIKNDVPV